MGKIKKKELKSKLAECVVIGFLIVSHLCLLFLVLFLW